MPRIVLAELSGVSEPQMIIRMTTRSRLQRRYDHRLRDLVQRTGEHGHAVHCYERQAA